MRTCLLLIFLAAAGVLYAQDTTDLPEFDFGFEEEAAEDEGVEAEERPFSLPLRGAFTLEAAHSTSVNPRWHKAGPAATFVGDWNGRFGQLFGEATLRYNQAYRWEGDPPSVVDARSLEGVVRELFWKKSSDRWSVTAGNAIVAWGEGDILTPSDVVTRRDTSLLLFEYPAASRLGQNLVQLSFYPSAEDQLDVLVVPMPLSDRLAPAGHADALFGEVPTRPAGSGELVELGARFRHRFGGGELALQGGYFHERRGMFAPGALFLERFTPGYGFVSVSGHRALGPFIWRGELSFSKDRPHQRWSPEGPDGFERRDVLSALMAADVASSRWGRVSLELGLSSGNPYAFDSFDASASALRTSLAANWLQTFFRGGLRAQASVVWQDGWENFLARIELAYRLRDGWDLTGKLTSLDDGALWGSFAQQTRVEINVRYSFDLGREHP